jgi:protein TonB
MAKIAAAVSRLLTTRDNGSSDRNGEAFSRYLAVSFLFHFVVVVILSISYTRSIRPVIPTGPYEVSLIQMEEPKPKRAAAKRPEPKPPQQQQKAVVPEKKKEEDTVKIKPEVKKPQKKPEKKPEPEPEKKAETPQEVPETRSAVEPESQEAAAVPDTLPAAQAETPSAPSVGGFQVDNPNFNFNYYLAMLRDKIQSNWRPPSGLPSKDGGYSAVVRFTVRRDGTIVATDVEESSGLRFFDQSALRAVVNSNPAPPLPRAYDEDRLGVHVSFVFSEENR